MTGISTRPDLPAQPLVLMSANSAWNIANFRMGLIAALRAAGFRVAVAVPADGREALLARHGIEFHPLPMRRSGLNPLADLLLLVRYWRLFRTMRPSAYLGYTIKPNIYGSLAAATLRIPAINTVTGLGTAFLGSGLLSAIATTLYRAAFRRSHAVFFQNRDDLHQFVSARLVDSGRARLVGGSGIDLRRFTPAPERDGAPLSFLFVGRLLRDKGVREFVTAARKVRAARPDIRFLLAGDLDPENRTSISRGELDTWVREGSVALLGPVDDVRPVIAEASAVVLPSYREGLPRTLLEGAAMAKPLVACDVPGSRELVIEGVTGALAEAGDAASLEAAIERVVAAGADGRRSLGARARRLVETEYGEDRVISAYLDSLAGILPSVGRPC